jgi:hypothetical protein
LLASVGAQFCTLPEAEKSRWAQIARSGKRVMQFLSENRYVANVADGNMCRRLSVIMAFVHRRDYFKN